MSKVLVFALLTMLIAVPASAWTITNAGFESGGTPPTGWSHNGSGTSDSSTVCGPAGPASYKDNAGIAGGTKWTGWQGGCASGVTAVVYQPVAGLSIGTPYDIQAGAVGCTNLSSGITWNVQLRAADGSPAVTTGNATSTGTLIESAAAAPGGGANPGGWMVFGDGGADNYTPGNTTVTLILYGSVTGSGWDNGSGIHWDGVTIDGITPVSDWTLY